MQKFGIVFASLRIAFITGPVGLCGTTGRKPHALVAIFCAPACRRHGLRLQDIDRAWRSVP
jgi:hypothetical protein